MERNGSDDFDVYLPAEIGKKLRVSTSKSYEYLHEVYKNKGPFRVIFIGTCPRVPKEDFDRWMSLTTSI